MTLGAIAAMAGVARDDLAAAEVALVDAVDHPHHPASLRFRSLSSAYFAQCRRSPSTWQSVQLRPREAEKNPIVPMNSSTGMPFRIWTFLKTSSAMRGCCACGAWPPRRPRRAPIRSLLRQAPERSSDRYRPNNYTLLQRRQKLEPQRLYKAPLLSRSALHPSADYRCDGGVVTRTNKMLDSGLRASDSGPDSRPPTVACRCAFHPIDARRSEPTSRGATMRSEKS